MTLFADDIMIHRPIRTPEDFDMLQLDIDNLASWTDQNFLQFNASKCKYMVISRKRQINSLTTLSQPSLQIKGIIMEQVDSYKYLGIWITANLSWSKISQMCVAKPDKKWASFIVNATKTLILPRC